MTSITPLGGAKNPVIFGYSALLHNAYVMEKKMHADKYFVKLYFTMGH